MDICTFLIEQSNHYNHNMERYKEYNVFGRQVSYIIAANIAVLLLGFVQLPILTKNLGASLYGIWSLIGVTVSLVAPFAMLGFSVSIVRFLAAEKDAGKVSEDFFSACSLVVIAGAAFSLLLFFLSDYLAVSIFGDAAASTYIKLGSALVLLNSLSGVLLAFFRMRRSIGLYTTLDLGRHVLQVGLVVAALLLGYRLGGAIMAAIASALVFSITALFIILRQTGFQLPRFSNMKSYLRWGLPLTPNTALMWVVHVSDRYMVSYFLGTAAAGIYSAAYAIGRYAGLFVDPVSIVLFPIISKTFDEGGRLETGNYMKYSLRYVMMVAIPSAFGLSTLARPLLQILTTPEFVAGSSVVPWVAAGAVLQCFYSARFIIHLVGKTHLATALLGVSAVLNVVLNLVLIPRLGITGAAVATLVSYGVLGVLTLAVTRRYLKFDLSLFFIAKSILASGVMALCIWLINPESIAMVITSILAGIVIYFGVLLLLRGLSREEIKFFAGFIRDNIGKVLMLK